MIPIIRTYNSLPNIIDEFLTNDSYGGKSVSQNYVCKPAVNIAENENSFRIDVAAPGFERSDLHVKIEKEMLVISSVSKENTGEEKEKYLKKEFTTGKFSRSFELPTSAEIDKIEAMHKNGILSIVVPKKAKVEIPVQEIEVKE
jgi:HSP20 family protein